MPQRLPVIVFALIMAVIPLLGLPGFMRLQPEDGGMLRPPRRRRRGLRSRRSLPIGHP